MNIFFNAPHIFYEIEKFRKTFILTLTLLKDKYKQRKILKNLKKPKL